MKKSTMVSLALASVTVGIGMQNLHASDTEEYNEEIIGKKMIVMNVNNEDLPVDHLIDDLFYGNYKKQYKTNYLEALEKRQEEYNQSISDASLFLAQQLEKEKDIKGALQAYAYAYYYNPYNESIPQYASNHFFSLKKENKSQFINEVKKTIK